MEQKIGDFYKSVIDSATTEKRGLEPLEELLQELEEVSTTEEYIELTAAWKSFGISSFNSIDCKM